MNIKKLIIIFLTAISPYVLFPLDSEWVYQVGFKPFDERNLSETSLHLVNSLPQQLAMGLQVCKTHIYSENEIKSQILKSIADHKKIKLIEFSELKKKYDNYIFEEEPDPLELKELEKKIIEKKREIEQINGETVESPSGFSEISFTSPELNYLSTDKEVLEKTDLIISGSIEEFEGWLYIKVYAVNNITDENELIYETVAEPETAASLLPEIISKLKTVLLGRAWSSIVLNLTPEDSQIELRDEKGEIVTDPLECMKPGKYRLRSFKEGFEEWTDEIVLQEFEIKTVDVVLKGKPVYRMSVQSFPSGADVYLGAMWMGRAPLIIDKPYSAAYMTLKMDGYNNSNLIIRENTEPDIKVFMERDIINRNEIINRRRNEFYRSFGFFIASIPLSIISYGQSSDYAYAYNQEYSLDPTSSEADRLKQLSTSWYSVYLGSIFLNAALFMNAVLDLKDYIGSTDRF